MSAERLRAMLSEATRQAPAPWAVHPSKSSMILTGNAWTSMAVGSPEVARLIALAPDAIALLADFGELLQAFYDDLPIEVSAGKKLLRRLDALCGDDR